MPEPVRVGEETGSSTAWIQNLIFTVDHKKLGLMYIGAALLFFAIAGVLAALMRIQLAFPDNRFLSPDVFNESFTMHGTTMVFLVGMPLAFGFANYLVPLMIGARDMAFPRLNAFGFWVFFFSGLFLYFSYFGAPGLYAAGSAPDVGWFAYSPLTMKAFSRGHSTDYWTLSLMLGGIASIATAVNILVTIVCMRCPGMTLGRMPIFVWCMLVLAFLVILAVPCLSACQIMITLDRYIGAKFFDTQAGGDAVLWQHFFWIFGHPEVYILVMPAFAITSEIIPVFSRKPIFGYPMMVAAVVAIAFLSLGVWAHHMFCVGMISLANAFFVTSTLLIAIPTGLKIFNWLATLYGGKLRYELPLVFCLGFLFQFLVSGLTGVMLAVAPFDWQLSDSYFVVAHFHYVLIGGLLFTIFGGIYYWFPKAFGKMPDHKLGMWHFWLFAIGFNLTFMPQHFLGFLGMPRRIYTYQSDRGWDELNLISTIGVLFQAVGILFFAYNLLYSWFRGRKAGDDPWDAWTLEWATTSPPADYNFSKTPVVKSRRPLWDAKHPDDPDWAHE
ncbi:MAG: cytochrome c oxidase subunit I [Verrucomicrobia bacterium]|nr:cytochrome c oxidase subunit I [Verrucomicrobiota bacterium]